MESEFYCFFCGIELEDLWCLGCGAVFLKDNNTITIVNMGEPEDV